MKEAYEKFPNLEKRIWKILATRIAMPLYLKEPQFKVGGRATKTMYI